MNRELQLLVALFRAAEALVEKELLRALVRGTAPSTAAERGRRLAEIGAILSGLRRDAIGSEGFGAAWDLIEAGYRKGLREAIPGQRGPATPLLGGIHVGAARQLYGALTDSLEDAIAYVGRRSNDVFRKVALNEILLGQIAGRRQAANAEAIAENLRSRGIDAFMDRRGRKWSLEDYASMVAATTAQEAQSTATMNRLAEAGIDTVKWMARPTVGEREPCEPCKKRDGQVYSMTGATEGYEVLFDAPPLHPRCGCILVAHVNIAGAA